MLGSKPLEAVLGSGVDNTDPEAVRAFIRSAADIGLSILFIWPDSKVPADMRTTAARNKADREAQAAAKEAGRRDWATVKSPAGLALATSDKTILDRYLKQYLKVFADKYPDGVPVNLAVEVGGSGVVVIDCDTAAQMERWLRVSMGSDYDPDRLPAPTVITPGHMGDDADPEDPSTWAHSDGGHFWFTVPDELMPVLPRHVGAMTWGGDDGFAVLWDRRYVLIPPSTRPEGRYEALGHIYDLPPWLAEEIQKAGDRRVQRAENNNPNKNEDLASAIDAWAENYSWDDILAPLGWSPAPRADSCGCAVWTAPGVHASPKSATAHDSGCSAGRYTAVNAPLHIWTDNPAEPFDQWVRDKGTSTISKLQAVALIHYGGGIGRAMDELGLTPDLSIEPGLDPKGVDRDLDPNGTGDFQLPTRDEIINDPDGSWAVDKQDPIIVEDSSVSATFPVDDPHCVPCRTNLGIFIVDPEDGKLWHAIDEDDAAETGGHLAAMYLVDAETGTKVDYQDVVVAETFADDLSDVPADFGKKPKAAESPYPDDVEDSDPDVFDSPHPGVPRMAPFSHWRDMPPPEYIVDGLVEHGGLWCLIGPPGVGKSTVALDLAAHIATGKRWQGRRTLKTRVLYLPGEGLSGAIERLRAWEEAHEIDLSRDFILGNGIIQVAAQNEAWGEVAAYIARQGIGVVIFDTFARCTSGLEENSATDVGKAVKRFDKLRELTHAGVGIVHHTAKGAPDVARGSSALNGALDSELLVREARWDTDSIRGDDGRLAGKPVELWTSKQKNAEQLEHPIPLMVVSHELRDSNPRRSTALITGPNGNIDPMQGEVVMARPVPEPIVETAIRIRAHLDNLPQQGATRVELVLAVRPDAYARSRADAAVYWKQRVGEAVDRGLRYGLIETLSGTPSGARYIPSTNGTPDTARTKAAGETIDQD